MSKAKENGKSGGKRRAAAGDPGADLRRAARRIAAGTAAVFALLCAAGDWYVHHPPEWLESHASPFTRPLEYFGDRTAFFTDAFGWTGHDAVYDTDDPAPEGQVFFAGAPVRVSSPAPSDIVTLRRGEFAVGWSPSLKHPVWVAYHVPREARFESTKRPNFTKDRSVASSPAPSAYAGSRYDRGHMAPNRAIVTRFGPVEQKKTFLMTNIAPQSPSLNRGPWREMEQRIADLWTAKYGEIWVVAGALSGTSPAARETISESRVDVPEKFYMIVAAQTADGVRALAVLLPQSAGRWTFPARHIVTIDELERLSGLKFFPDMPEFLKRPLAADRPTRLWPVRFADALKLLLLRFA